MDIREYIKENRLIADGSFGTYYCEKYNTNEPPEYANILHPDRVYEIHEEYVKSGARLIRTNTFASNSFLFSNKSNLIENIIFSIDIAKKVKKNYQDKMELFIAGDIGPIESSEISDDDKEKEYYNIAKLFIDNGINIINFETFSESDILINVAKKLKQEYSDIFIITQFCVNQFGYSNMSFSAKKLIFEVSECKDIDCIGFNCGVGPAHMKKILSEIGTDFGKYFIVLPNSGYPKKIRNRIVFSDNKSYFCENMAEIKEMGVDILGGCCGTNPEFIKMLNNICSDNNKGIKIKIDGIKIHDVKSSSGFYYDKDGNVKKDKLIAVELAPPLNVNDRNILNAAKILEKANVDIVTLPDSPSGRTRVDSVLMAEKIKNMTGLEVMPHICCRDKNAIAMRSQIMGAYINGINNLLIITGDPVPSVARQNVKSVFNFESVGLMKIIKDMNQELFSENPMTYGGAINQDRNIEVELKRVIKKMEAGATFFMSQPVFSDNDVTNLRTIKEKTDARILCGIMPLISKKNALFIKNEIAGINVTDEIVARFSDTDTREDGEEIGISIAKEVITKVSDFCDGYYFTFPFNRVSMLEKILKL